MFNNIDFTDPQNIEKYFPDNFDDYNDKFSSDPEEQSNTFDNNNSIQENQKNDLNKEKIQNKNDDSVKVIEKITISSSSSSGCEIIQNEKYIEDTQKDKFYQEPKIGIANINPEELKMNFFPKKGEKEYDKQTEEKIWNTFFLTSFNSNSNNYKNPNTSYRKDQNQNKINNTKVKHNKFSPNLIGNIQNNRDNFNPFIGKKRRKFSPLPKECFQGNRSFSKLLLDRVEKEILTDIYNNYSGNKNFDSNFNHICEIKRLLIFQGIDEAMKYIEQIPENESKNELLIEISYYFKGIIKEEMRVAGENNGKLVLIRRPDFKKKSKNKNKIILTNKNILNTKNNWENYLNKRNESIINKENKQSNGNNYKNQNSNVYKVIDEDEEENHNELVKNEGENNQCNLEQSNDQNLWENEIIKKRKLINSIPRNCSIEKKTKEKRKKSKEEMEIRVKEENWI